MKTLSVILFVLVLGLLNFRCSSGTDSDNDSAATQGKITVSGDYQATFKYVMGISDGSKYYGVIATQSLYVLEDEYGFGLYSDGHAVFTKSLGDWQWLGYTATDLDAYYDVSDTCKPRLVVNNIVLYYDSSYKSLEPWEFNPENLDSSKSVMIDGEMSTDYRKLGICPN